jgi:hypothetical protein
MADEIDRDALMQKWIHSHEEDTDNETVFRPSSYRFPRSRGRRSFQLAPDGSMVEQGIGSDDRPTQVSGSWKLNDANELELVRPNGSKTVLPLIRVDSNRLVVKKS